MKSFEELSQMITDIGDTHYQSAEKITELLKFASKFYNYSSRNMKLIYSQNPHANFVGSFKKFKDLGYSVKKGEKGLKILVPTIQDMTDYGYTFESGILPITKEEAKSLFDADCGKVFVLHRDNTKSIINDLEDIAHSKDDALFVTSTNVMKKYKSQKNLYESVNRENTVLAEIEENGENNTFNLTDDVISDYCRSFSDEKLSKNDAVERFIQKNTDKVIKIENKPLKSINIDF